METHDIISLVLSGASMLVSIAVAVQQRADSKAISDAQTKANSALAKVNDETARWIHSNESTLQRRTSFFELWPHISSLDRVDPKAAIQVNVIKAANALELTAICWEAGVVDTHMIEVSFGGGYVEMYDNVDATPVLPNGKTGRDMLRANPLVKKLYDRLLKNREDRAQIPS